MFPLAQLLLQTPRYGSVFWVVSSRERRHPRALTAHCDLLAVTGRDPVDVRQLGQVLPGLVQKIEDVASMELLLGGKKGTEKKDTGGPTFAGECPANLGPQKEPCKLRILLRSTLFPFLLSHLSLCKHRVTPSFRLVYKTLPLKSSACLS